MAHTKVQTVGDHVRELQLRLVWVTLVFIAGALVGYEYHAQIITFLTQFLHGSSLYYSNPAGSFNFIMKISVLAGAIVAVPLLVYQVIKFTEPAITQHNRYKRVWVVALLSLFLALGGVAFALGFVVPVSLHFFAGFQVEGLQPLLSADEYLNYVIKALTWFAVLFQIPLLMLFINRITPLQPRKLLRYEKFVVVGSLVIALLLPFAYDPVTQLIIAVPIILLYNLSVLFVWYANQTARAPIEPNPRDQGNQQEPVSVASEPVSAVRPNVPRRPAAGYKQSQPGVARVSISNRPVKRRPVHDITPMRATVSSRLAARHMVPAEKPQRRPVQPITQSRPVAMDIIIPEA